MKIEKIGVIGAGIMGCGIAQVVAQCGIDVIMVDIDDHALNRGLNSINKSLSIFEEKDIFNREQVEVIKANYISNGQNLKMMEGHLFLLPASMQNL